MFKIQTKNPTETSAWAESVGTKVVPGLVLCLDGDLGAGKTLFVQGLAKSLHIQEEVTSPTFNLMNIYEGDCVLHHFDLYRLETEDELDEIGFYEYSEAVDDVVIIEWSDKFIDCLPEDYIHIELDRTGKEDERTITVSLHGEKNQKFYEELEKSCRF